MYRIVHTSDCAESAERLAVKLGECELFELEELIKAPEGLGDFTELGLVFRKEGKGVPASVVEFVSKVLGSYDLRSLEYLFSICVCDGKPEHALKVVEKLCSKVGCAPSLSLAMSPTADAQTVDAISERIMKGDIQLAKGSIGTMFFMKFAMKV